MAAHHYYDSCKKALLRCDIPAEKLRSRQDIGLLELIPQIMEVWTSRRHNLEQSAAVVASRLQQFYAPADALAIGEEVLTRAFERLHDSFDEIRGGFGGAPKFPTPHHLTFLLRYWKRTGDRRALHMVEKTLCELRRGGIYDHVGFGFHRYSTDESWCVPHFEKMLYDQAMLSMAYTEMYQATGEEKYKEVTSEIATYVLRDLTAREGGFFSAEDADSEGGEGRYYLWTEHEINMLHGDGDDELVKKLFHVTGEGNYREEATGGKTGYNILYLNKYPFELAAELGMPLDLFNRKLAAIHNRFMTARDNRARPHRDDKILTDWNGLMIAALAKASQIMEDLACISAAKKAAQFILRSLKNNGKLLHRYRDGEWAIPAFLDDYAFLVWGLLELYESTFESKYLEKAITITDMQLRDFWDNERGAFYFTAANAESVLIRRKELYDGSVPSGNSVSMLNLLRLSRITARQEYATKAAGIMRYFSSRIRQTPVAYTQLLSALDFRFGDPIEIIIIAESNSAEAERLLTTIRQMYIPNKVMLFCPMDRESPRMGRIAEYTRHMRSIDDKPTVYVCRDYSCNEPTTDLEKVVKLITP